MTKIKVLKSSKEQAKHFICHDMALLIKFLGKILMFFIFLYFAVMGFANHIQEKVESGLIRHQQQLLESQTKQIKSLESDLIFSIYETDECRKDSQNEI